MDIVERMDAILKEDAGMIESKVKVNLSGLETKLSKILGVPVGLTGSIQGDMRRKYIKINSKNLVEHTGIMQAAFSEVTIENFGGGELDDPGVFWVPVNFKYILKDNRGSNGVSILTAWYDSNADEKWRFE